MMQLSWEIPATKKALLTHWADKQPWAICPSCGQSTVRGLHWSRTGKFLEFECRGCDLKRGVWHADVRLT